MLDFIVENKQKLIYILIAIVIALAMVFINQPSNITAMQNARIDAKKTVTTSSDKMSGNAKKIGNIGSVDGDLNL